MARMMSGRVTFRISLQPSCPSKSSSVASLTCSMDPIAPSAIITRSLSAARSAAGPAAVTGGRSAAAGLAWFSWPGR
jgi:hypothetical protein